MAYLYCITGGACTGKTTLALWLCRRLPRPLAGLRTLCTGRCGGGLLFSLQDLATGCIQPLMREEAGAPVLRPETLTGFAAPALAAATRRGQGTVLVDEAGALAEDAACRQALESLRDSSCAVVCTVDAARRDALASLWADRPVEWLDLDADGPETLRARLAAALPAPLHVGVSVRLFREEKCFGPGPLQLLELVGRTGSLHRAAAVMGMAYSKAWKMLRALEDQWGFAMLQRHPGGSGGGGSLLTPEAWDLLARYRALRWESEQAAAASFARWFGDFCPQAPTDER